MQVCTSLQTDNHTSTPTLIHQCSSHSRLTARLQHSQYTASAYCCALIHRDVVLRYSSLGACSPVAGLACASLRWWTMSSNASAWTLRRIFGPIRMLHIDSAILSSCVFYVDEWRVKYQQQWNLHIKSTSLFSTNLRRNVQVMQQSYHWTTWNNIGIYYVNFYHCNTVASVNLWRSVCTRQTVVLSCHTTSVLQ